MKRFYGIAAAVFLGLMTIALVGGESTAVAGHGCCGVSECSGDDCGGRHARRQNRCHGRRHERCHGRERCHGLFGHRRNKCDGAAECCGETVVACDSCGGDAGCPNGDCGGEGVIVEDAAPEAAPEAPEAPVEATGTSFRGTIFRN
ncbi:MAG: hypothetical protein ISQ70_06645 [Pirellulales bacterium]|nr:hypothetical protein [Pirellulales bacterium]MBL7192831.1 hypothetical protein [Pirellulales bacterium]